MLMVAHSFDPPGTGDLLSRNLLRLILPIPRMHRTGIVGVNRTRQRGRVFLPARTSAMPAMAKKLQIHQTACEASL